MTSNTASNADICYASATELMACYKTGTLTPTEAVTAIFERIHAVNPSINAFSYLLEDQALAAAAASMERIRRGEALPLDGVPVTIKDFYDVEGVTTETGSLSMPGKVAKADNPVVKRLRDSGAVIIGKTTMSELAWSGMSRNPVNGVTHNPWGYGLNAGASSAGAGTAAAAGFGPMHLGSDGAGSIRMPAHFCGVYGLKPTYGRVPHVPVSNNDYGTHIGPMSRTVADSALMLEVMAGPHYLDHTSCECPPAPYYKNLEADMKGKKIAFSMDIGFARIDDEVADVVRKAIGALERDIQADVVETVPAWGPEGREIGRFFWTAFWGRRSNLLPDFADQMGSDLVACIREGAGITSKEYLTEREKKFTYITRINSFLEEYDFLVTPTASVAAFPVERVRPEHWPEHAWDWLEWSEYLYPFNLSGNPAASLPCGFTPDGLPVGLQIVGKRFDDQGVLQLSAALEKALSVWSKRPKIAAAA